MFSVVIATSESERTLVPTLAALVPGATAGLVREVIVADGNSRDETAQVADIAGCRFIASSEPLGARLRAAAASARSPWLMFLRPGVVPEPSWIDEAIAFVERAQLAGGRPAATFGAARAGTGDLTAWLRKMTGMLPRPAQGLMLPKSLYDELGGHRADAADPETDLIRRLGRRRLAVLRSAVLDGSNS